MWQYKFFCLWLLSLNITLVIFICVVACSRNSFIFIIVRNYIMWMYHNLFLHRQVISSVWLLFRVLFGNKMGNRRNQVQWVNEWMCFLNYAKWCPSTPKWLGPGAWGPGPSPSWAPWERLYCPQCHLPQARLGWHHLFIHSFIQQINIKHLPCARVVLESGDTSSMKTDDNCYSRGACF